MGGCLRILIGYVLGILTAIFVLPNIVNMPGNEETEESVKLRSEYNIKTRQGKTVTLYMGMPKDSVIMLLGEPQSFSASGHSDYEYLEYMTGTNRSYSSIPDLNLTFESGRLSNIRKD